MKKVTQVCFVISGGLLILDAILMILQKPNPVGLPLPCPITLIFLGVGLISFAFSKH